MSTYDDYFDDEVYIGGQEIADGVEYILNQNQPTNTTINGDVMNVLNVPLPEVELVDNFWESGIEIIDTCGTSPKTVDVIIYPTAKAKIESLMDHYSHMEWLAYLTGDLVSIDGVYHVRDIVIPEQRVTPVAVFDIKDPGVITMGVIHSHHDMGNGFSHTDDEYINQNNDISLCVSVKGIQGHVRIKTDCGKYHLVDALVKNWNDDFDITSFIAEAESKITVGRVVHISTEPSGFHQEIQDISRDVSRDVSRASKKYTKSLSLSTGITHNNVLEMLSIIDIIDTLRDIDTVAGVFDYDNNVTAFYTNINDMSFESIELVDQIDIDCESVTALEMRDLMILRQVLLSEIEMYVDDINLT